ncbi:MAG: phospholipase D-like domain-containing protein [Cyanobacteriota bacterium]|nr:phospholipase D-like domain-containing protein [Cyanobacteriota bacterium]
MDNEIKYFENKIRKYHSLPEAIVLDSKPIGYPFYVLHLDLTYLANRELQLLEEFVLKCIANWLVKPQEISSFLGMESYQIEKVLSELISKDLVKKEENLELTTAGLNVLEQQTVLAPISETQTFYLDALNGKLINSNSFSLKNFDSKNHKNSAINKIIKKPRKGHIEDLVNYYPDIEKILQNSHPNNSNAIELLQVNNLEKIYSQWHEILLVLYKSNPGDREIEYEIFSRGSIQIEYRNIIEQLYAEGEKILEPIFREMEQDELPRNSGKEVIFSINDDDIKTVEKLTAKIDSLNDPDNFVETKNNSLKQEKQKIQQQLKEIQNQTRISEVVHTYQIREYLFKGLKEAKNRLMIVSPWIKANVVDKEFISTLEATLKRKVKVYIIYGIKGSNPQNDSQSIKQLNNLEANYKNITFQRTENSHRKQIICDDKFAIVTSFNFLSFRADFNLTYRDELGVILRDKQTIEDLFNSGINLIS